VAAALKVAAAKGARVFSFRVSKAYVYSGQGDKASG